jgi:hypothetical protein
MDVLVTTKDMRACKFCVRGAKIWIDQNGFDWKTFTRVGLPADELLKVGDPMSKQIVEAALKRVNDGR